MSIQPADTAASSRDETRSVLGLDIKLNKRTALGEALGGAR